MSDTTFSKTYDNDLLILTKDVELVLGTAMLGSEFGTIKAAGIRRTGEREVITNDIGEVLVVIIKTPGFELTLKCAFGQNVMAPAMGERLALPFVGLVGYVMEGVTVEWEQGTERGMSIPVSSWDSMTDAVAYRYVPGETLRLELGDVSVPAPTLAPGLVGEADGLVNRLTWSAVTRAAEYEVEWLGESGGWTDLVTTELLTTAHTGRAYYDVTSYRVRAKNAAGDGPWSDSVTLTTLIPLITQRPVLTDLDDGALSYQPGVSWGAIPHAEGYIVELGADGSWSAEAELDAETTEWRNEDLAMDQSHTVRIIAVNSRNRSVASVPVTQTAGRLAAPAILGEPAAGIVVLTWSVPPVSGLLTTFEAQVSDDLGVTWTALVTTTDTSFINTYVNANEEFTYRVRASNVVETGPWSESVTYQGFGLPRTTVAASVSVSGIQLTWTALPVAGGATVTYEVQWRRVTSNDWLALHTGTVASYLHEHVGSGIDVEYRVRLTTPEESGPWSVPRRITPLGLPPPVMEHSTAPGAITLSWDDYPPLLGLANNYELQISPNGTSWTEIYSGTGLEFTHSYARGGVALRFRLRISNAAATGSWSDPLLITPPLLARKTMTITTTPGVVRLTWTATEDVMELPHNYELESSTDAGVTWTRLLTSTALEYNHSYISGGTALRYRLRYTNAEESAPWSVVRLVTHPGLAKPTMQPYSWASSTNVQLSYTAGGTRGGVTTPARVQRSQDDGATWTLIAEGASINGGMTVTGPGTGQTWLFRVQEYNVNEASPWSDPQEVTTASRAVPDLAVRPEGAGFFYASFPPLPDAIGYEIRWSVNGVVSGAPMTSANGEITVAPGLISAMTPELARINDTYDFQARAQFADAWSDWSDAVSVSGSIYPLPPELSWDPVTMVLTIILSTTDSGINGFQMNPMPPGGGAVQPIAGGFTVDLSEWEEAIRFGAPGYTEARVQAVRQIGWYIGGEAVIQLYIP